MDNLYLYYTSREFEMVEKKSAYHFGYGKYNTFKFVQQSMLGQGRGKQGNPITFPRLHSLDIKLVCL